jgi:hypothetical protein
MLGEQKLRLIIFTGSDISVAQYQVPIKHTVFVNYRLASLKEGIYVTNSQTATIMLHKSVSRMRFCVHTCVYANRLYFVFIVRIILVRSIKQYRHDVHRKFRVRRKLWRIIFRVYKYLSQGDVISPLLFRDPGVRL